MKAFGLASVFAVAVSAAAAFPQNGPTFDTELFDAGDICLSASDGSGPDKAIADCKRAIVLLDEVRARHPSAVQADVNLYLYLKAFSYSTIARSLGDAAGGMRTARVCEAVETSWASFSAIVLSASSPEDRELFEEGKKGWATTVGLCRSENGTPTGAPPLP
jgi:hypothetical protein